MGILHLGDCLDPITGLASLTPGSIDHVVTDPPYTDHVHRALATRGRALGFDPITDQQMAELAAAFRRAARRWVIVFCAAEQVGDWEKAMLAAGLEYVRTGAWVKTDAAPQLSGDRPSAGFEALAIGHQPGKKRWNGGGKAAVWTGPAQERQCKRIHPTQKPLWLLEALLRDFTDPDDVILDPFAGSGTTGVACRRLGRRLVGWERDADHHAAAQRRIQGARQQLEILAAPTKAKQETLL